MVKNLPAMRETWVQSLGWEDSLLYVKKNFEKSIRQGKQSYKIGDIRHLRNSIVIEGEISI